jgi:tetratricopeptide (TPR) repeat protein
LTTIGLQHAKDTGVLTMLRYALTHRVIAHLHFGELGAADVLVEKAAAISAVTGSPSLACASLVLAGWRGQEQRAFALFDAARRDAHDRGEGITVTAANFAEAVLYNGLGRYDAALAAARNAVQLDELSLFGWSLAELIEAAARSGQPDEAASVLETLSERVRVSGTDWALGIEARSRALLIDGESAEDLYLEAIERLERSRIKIHLTRAQLVYVSGCAVGADESTLARRYAPPTSHFWRWARKPLPNVPTASTLPPARRRVAVRWKAAGNSLPRKRVLRCWLARA